ncbi:hypothetical protein HF086_012940 [Spodoptera exigua]|uniref:Uncharacterized protein n=1 Tax=Spodoptera exigua TaxID=7107 RepID=A0A922MMU9_SPOEX|nr:hypothetical protein HF086_012940 [Spodoptera exigua]
MKTVLVLAGLVALVMGSAVPHHHNIKLKPGGFFATILTLWQKCTNTSNHTCNKQAVDEFLLLYRTGTLPKYYKFSIFYERMRDEAIALFHVLYYAKDFDTFYKTACWAKVYMNGEQFLYAYYIAIVQRADTDGIVLPAPYEVYPEFFFNGKVMHQLYRTKMQSYPFEDKFAAQYGIVKENNNYVFYANYSTSLSYPNQEQKLSYFTEDIGLNSYYFYFHSQMPFWWKSEKLSVLKDRLGEPEKEMNYVGNYWHMNSDLYAEKSNKDLHQYSYEIIARHVLGASPKPFDKYSFMPSALDFYQTSLRDPAFYQLYQRIIDYLIDYKQYVKPYDHNDLHFVGVKINDVQVSDLVTYFDYFDFNATNSVYYNKEELQTYPVNYIVRQPRLNHKPFSVKLDVKSDAASDAVFKIFIGPKYHANGYPVNIEDDWMKFYELDWFVQKLVPGENKIERKSSEFVLFKDDSVPINEIYEFLDQAKVPYDMSVQPDNMPRRLMLPKGTLGGYPFQLFVFVYPYNSVKKGDNVFESYILDNKPFGYPFDRPVREAYFRQPNVFFKDVRIYHKDAYLPYELNVPSYFLQNKM